jgi:hypothetical protein
MRTNWHDNIYTQLVNMPDDALVDQNYPVSGSYIDVSEFTHFAFLIALGATDSAMTPQVYQDTSATETASIKVITGAVESMAANADDSIFVIEVETARLDLANSFRYVCLKPAGAAGGDDYGCILFLGWNARHLPVTQHASFPAANYTGLVG